MYTWVCKERKAILFFPRQIEQSRPTQREIYRQLHLRKKIIRQKRVFSLSASLFFNFRDIARKKLFLFKTM
jgi:hypothetical protein